MEYGGKRKPESKKGEKNNNKKKQVGSTKKRIEIKTNI